MKNRVAAFLTTAILHCSAYGATAAEPTFNEPVETIKAASETASFFDAFFTAKSNHDVDATMSFFSPDLLTYSDATLGMASDGFEILRDVFASYMPQWGKGRSYPLRIIGGPNSAIVAFVDTPELFGGELRPLGVVDFADGKIVRWVDYWDSTGFPVSVYEQMRAPAEKFPMEFKESAISDNADQALVAVATSMQQALAANDAQKASELLSSDAIYEDLALRTQILGGAAITRYFARVLQTAPFGEGAELVHIVGGATGGGFEWRSSDGAIPGVVAIELDGNGMISRITTTYDSRLIGEDERKKLHALSAEQL